MGYIVKSIFPQMNAKYTQIKAEASIKVLCACGAQTKYSGLFEFICRKMLFT